MWFCTFSCFCVEDISLQCVPVPLAGSSGEISLFMSSFLLVYFSFFLVTNLFFFFFSWNIQFKGIGCNCLCHICYSAMKFKMSEYRPS